MKGAVFISAAALLAMAVCGVANVFSIEPGNMVALLYDPDTGCILGGVLLTMGVIWPKRLIKK